MTKQNWFKPITVVSHAKLMKKLARERDRKLPPPTIRGIKLVDIDSWPHPRAGVTVNYLGNDELFFTTRDIEKIFDISRVTVYNWQKIGILPPPLLTKTNHYNKETRYYVRPQLAVVQKVVNDLRRQGLLRFTVEKTKHHVEMVKQGNKEALERWHKRRDTANRRKKKASVTWVER